MANRIVTASVSGETIKLSNKLAGASGSHNAVSLAFTFDSAWDDTTKKVYFFDAYGENAVYRLLTTDLLVDGAYIVPIPSEPLAHSGDMTITIRGVEMDDDVAERIIMSASTTMKVAEAVTPDADVAPVEPTPTQAEQLLSAVNSVTGMTATATELSSGEPASVTKTTNLDGTINLEFGLPAGPKGDKGEKGEQGQQGIQGIQGETGAKGDAATITVGTTTTGAAGTAASVVNVGTTGAAILNFTIPRGHDGDGAGDMTAAVYDPTNKQADAFDMDNMVDGTTNKVLTATEKATWNAKSDKGEAFAVNLTVAGWSGNTQTVSDARFSTSGYGYVVSPSPADFAEYGMAVIRASDVTTEGQMTFTCGEVPSQALTVNVLRIEVSA